MMKIKSKKLIVGILVLALFVMYGVYPEVGQAVSYQSISDTISDSDMSASSVTHTIVASTTVTIPGTGGGGYIEFVFPSGFTSVASSNLTCPGGGTASSTGTNTVACQYSSPLTATSATFILTGTTNPSNNGSYTINVYSRQHDGTELEKGQAMVAIIDDVTVTATVDATLTFNIDGLATSSHVNGVVTTGSSTHNTLAFGTLTVGASSSLGQLLKVTTNAAYGFTVTVEQDQNLLSSNGADIDSFIDGTAASTTAVAWVSPAGTLGSEQTYGHFGFTAADTSLSIASFGSGNHKGFYGTDPQEVMYHTGPADGSTDYIGSSTVAYTIEINALQEAGDYTNSLTYICTPTY